MTRKPKKKTKPVDPDKFQVINKNYVIVRLNLDVVLYTEKEFYEIPEAVLFAYEKFLATCPADQVKWYATENMTHHKELTPRALNMLRDWLKPGAPKRDILHLEIKDGDIYGVAAGYSFWAMSNEEGSDGYGFDANLVRCTFPVTGEPGKAIDLLEFTIDLCNHFPFQSGHAGYVLETTSYDREASETAAWEIAMRHPGLDISNPITDSLAVMQEAIKGVNWLTILSNDFVDRLGGQATLRNNLPETIELLTVSGGVIIKAGSEPQVGDIEKGDLLPEYKTVYDVVSPLQESIIDRYGSLDLPGGGHREKTQAWLKRFEYNHE